MLILKDGHLEIEGDCPTSWRPQIPIEVFDPWTSRWYPVDYVSCTRGFVFYPARIRTNDLKNLNVRVVE
jgi:hypothetical protein